MSETGTWFEVDAGKSREAKWKRSIWRSSDGTIYLPAILSGQSENTIMLCAGYDGTGVVAFNNHLYVPAQWLAAEFPTCREACEVTIARVNRLMATPQASK